MDFLKKIRKAMGMTSAKLGVTTKIPQPTLSKIENGMEYLGESRAKIIGDALDIPEDVMTVYRGHLPGYAKKTYKEMPDKLEKGIRKVIKKLEEDDGGGQLKNLPH